ncbi:hypothetical protein ABL78_8524 [Leptomonas seymouri]|uniref:Uncharacterized protein n=1 Tax=Leptomonas seymouri TaxID=5684 RepID=A0A0N0P228_LEPSE|nr:hypothetical protein ABL78_8524 [Leptomonas seymouri]|eukprot:KPI82466.1 hypothetical protein ABL78_8524 [Leptomonas seymouri]
MLRQPRSHHVLITLDEDAAFDRRANHHFVRLNALRIVTTARGIGVALLRVHVAVRVVNQPIIRLLHQTTVAALIDGVAADQLLLRQAHQRMARNLPLAFDVADCRECPAGAALALVLHGSHSAFSAPVLRRRSSGHVRAHHRQLRCKLLRRLEVRSAAQVVPAKLALREVEELRDAERRVRVAGLVHLHHL